MATVKIKGADVLAKALNRKLRIVLNKVFRDKDLRKLVGKIIADDIKANVDFRAAKPSTIKTREYLERFNTTDPQYKKTRVKALFSGQLINDLANNVKGFPTKQTFEVKHSGKKHKGYKTKNGKTKSIPFQELSDILVNDMNLNYFNITDEAQAEILEAVQNKFFDELA